MSRLQDIIKHCIEATTIHEHMQSDYILEEMEDEENTVILHAGDGFLTPELTENLRKRLIFVDATNASTKDRYSIKYFLHYLEPAENTFMDSLAEPLREGIRPEKVVEVVDDSLNELPSHDICQTVGKLAEKIKEKTRAKGDTPSNG